MPVANIVSPSGELYSIEEAPAALEAEGILPYEVALRLVSRLNSPRRGDVRVSPSMMDASTTCRREAAIKAFLPYAVDLRTQWSMEEGTLIHQALEEAGRTGNTEGVHYEYGLPVDGAGGSLEEAEIFPGIFVHGTIDKLDLNSKTLTDFKSSRWPRTNKAGAPIDYGVKQDWIIQTNLYRRLVKVCLDVDIENIFVWRIYSGSYNHNYTFRKFPIPIMPDAALEAAVRPHYESLKSYLTKTKFGAADTRTSIKAIPLDGRNMFAGKKCSQYCAVRDICDEIEGISLGLRF